MRDPLLTESVIILETFSTFTDVPAFTSDERKELTESISAAKNKIATLSARRAKLLESVSAPKAIDKAIMNEILRLERLTILEAVSSLSVTELVNQLGSIMNSIGPISSLSEGVVAELTKKAETASALATEVEDLGGAGLQTEFRKKLNEFKSVFADISSIVKGLVAISDEILGGTLREILEPVLVWVVKRKQKTVTMLESMMAYDDEVNRASGGGSDVPMKQGMFSKLFSKKPAGVGSSNTAEKFKSEFDRIVKSRAPGFGQLSAQLGSDMLKRPIKSVFQAIHAFDDSVARNIDLNILNDMSKQTWGQALKGFFGNALQGRGMGVGMPGGGTAGRA